MKTSALQLGIEIERPAIRPVHQITKQVGEGILVIRVGLVLEGADCKACPQGAFLILVLGVWREFHGMASLRLSGHEALLLRVEGAAAAAPLALAESRG
jgi:hypothetical protein